jgi:hypothetical protein
MVILGVTEQVWTRRVNDGTLTVIVAEEPEGWHLSTGAVTAATRAGTRSPTPATSTPPTTSPWP